MKYMISKDKGITLNLLCFLLFLQILPLPLLSILCAFFSLIIYIFFIKNKECSIFYNIRFYFCVLYFLYANTASFIYFVFKSNFFVFSLSDDTIIKGVRIANSAFILFIIFSILSYTKRKDILRQYNIKNWLRTVKMRGNLFFFDALFLFGYFRNISKFMQIGISTIIAGEGRDASLEMMEASSGQSQIFSTLLSDFVIAYSCLVINQVFQMFFKQKKNDSLMFIRGFLVCTHWAIYLVLGGRIRFLSIAIFAIISYFVLKNNVKKKDIVFIVILGIFFALFGYFRFFGFGFSGVALARMIFYSFGEFLAPVQGLFVLIEKPDSFQYNITYLNLFLYLIPRSIYPNKPPILCFAFSNDMGLSYNILIHPIIETYMNFGIFSIFFMPLIYHSIFNAIEKMTKKIPAFYIIMVATIFPFVRYDIGYYFLGMLGVIIGFLILPKKIVGKYG